MIFKRISPEAKTEGSRNETKGKGKSAGQIRRNRRSRRPTDGLVDTSIPNLPVTLSVEEAAIVLQTSREGVWLRFTLVRFLRTGLAEPIVFQQASFSNRARPAHSTK